MLLHSLFKHWSYRLFAPGAMLRQTYDAFKTLLEEDARSHDLMAEFELLFHEGRREDFSRISLRFEEFSSAVRAMITALEKMHPADAATLGAYYKKFDFYVRFLLAPPEQSILAPYAVDFDGIDDPDQVGNKACNLSVLKNELSLPVPDGFAITTSAFFKLIEHNSLRGPINELLAQVNIEDVQSVTGLSRELQNLIRGAEIPPVVADEILAAYDGLERKRGGPVRTAVRSSAVSEDGVHSFAGQYQSVLDVGRDTVLAEYLQVAASKYSPEALFYRITVGLSDEETPIGVLVVAMVDAAAGGVVYTRDPAGERNHLVVHSIYGLGELLVGGETNADALYFDRESLSVVERKKGTQGKKLTTGPGDLEEHILSEGEQKNPPITEANAAVLARWSLAIESHFGCPQDIEWAMTGDETLFLLQARPLQIEEGSPANEEHPETVDAPVLLRGGKKASGGIAAGRVFSASGLDLNTMEAGSVLVSPNTPPSLVRIMDRLAAVVADRGSAAGHFATVCREFGVPLLVNTGDATSRLESGRMVTVDADKAVVYDGMVAGLPGGRGRSTGRDLPYFRKLRAVLDFITPLNLLDPGSDDFVPGSCRSFHDIIRYTHEQAVQTMFAMGDKISGRSGNCRQLQTDLPLEVYLLDVGEGIKRQADGTDRVSLDEIGSVPFLALWRGLSHPGVDWETHSHFDWKSFDDIALAGGIATAKSGDFASYAVISRDYLNLNMRFGYHFTLVDALCGDDSRSNYCQLRFAGGGGDYTGKSLRIEFLTGVLTRLGLEVTVRADLLDARMGDVASDVLCEVLDQLGRLLGASKLMDMVLKENCGVQEYVERFFNGVYDFSRIK